MMGRHRWVRGVVLLGGLALLGALLVRVGAGQVVVLFQTLGWNLAIVVLIYFAHECVRALALRRCLGPVSPPLTRLLETRFAGEGIRTLTYTGPLLSEPARAWMLTRDGLSGERAAAATASELIVNSAMSALVAVVSLIAMLGMPALGAALRAFTHVVVWTSLAYAALVAVVLVRRIHVLGPTVRMAARLPVLGRRFHVPPARLQVMEEFIFQSLSDRPSALLHVVLLQVLAQMILVLDVYWTLRAMGVSDSPLLSIRIEALTKLVNVVQFVGASEGGYALIFDWLSLSTAAGFTLSLVKRVRSLAVAALGVAFFSTSLRRDVAKPKRVPAVPS